MHSTQDPIHSLQSYIEEWGLATEAELKVSTSLTQLCSHLLTCCQKIDKDAKASVDQDVEEAKKSPEPNLKDLWTDIYYKGTEPPLSVEGSVRRCISLIGRSYTQPSAPNAESRPFPLKEGGKLQLAGWNRGDLQVREDENRVGKGVASPGNRLEVRSSKRRAYNLLISS